MFISSVILYKVIVTRLAGIFPDGMEFAIYSVF